MMTMTQKLTILVFGLHDGQKTKEDNMTSNRKKHRVR